jgi:queuine tRNA-ribosyltransferase
VIEAGRVIGSDILMPLDECPAYPCGRDQAATAAARTNRWAVRSLEQFGAQLGRYGHSQALFGIIQGGTYPDLRGESAAALRSLGFDGYAIGGLAVGEPAGTMYGIIDVCTAEMPAERPRYLMGVGTPENLIEAIARGVDMFDCVLPTRNGRNAMFFTRTGPLTITNARHADEEEPVEEGCQCYGCRTFSRSYLRHLFNVKEIAGMTIATIHNLHHYKRLMEEARAAILAGAFEKWSSARLSELAATAEPARVDTVDK